jgi:hypothetical protein
VENRFVSASWYSAESSRLLRLQGASAWATRADAERFALDKTLWSGVRVFLEPMPQLKRLVAGSSPQLPGCDARSGHVVDKVVLRQVFSEHFGFPFQFLFYLLLHTHHLSSGAGTVGQIVADAPSGLSRTPTKEINQNKAPTRSRSQKLQN